MRGIIMPNTKCQENYKKILISIDNTDIFLKNMDTRQYLKFAYIYITDLL